ncbi:hypothetical protein [Emticicia aquatilis]|nr:hypothetical protein [Emticicia aquatilis]
MTDEELFAEGKKQKKNKIYAGFAIGMMIGVAFWSIIHKGFILPVAIFVVIFYFAKRTNDGYQAVKKEIDSRKVL